MEIDLGNKPSPRRLPPLSHIDLARVAIGYCQARKRVDFGLYAALMVVSLDANPGRAVKIYKDRLGIKFPILDDSDQAISSMFGFYFSPAAVIVDKDGKVSQQFSGYAPATKEEVMSAFKKFAN